MDLYRERNGTVRRNGTEAGGIQVSGEVKEKNVNYKIEETEHLLVSVISIMNDVQAS